MGDLLSWPHWSDPKRVVVPSQPVDVIKRSSRWTAQRWLLDAVIGLRPFLVTADEAPADGSGPRPTTRLNGQIVQRA
jgi:hypothetical protein